jgi:hypothetical protein
MAKIVNYEAHPIVDKWTPVCLNCPLARPQCESLFCPVKVALKTRKTPEEMLKIIKLAGKGIKMPVIA